MTTRFKTDDEFLGAITELIIAAPTLEEAEVIKVSCFNVVAEHAVGFVFDKEMTDPRRKVFLHLLAAVLDTVGPNWGQQLIDLVVDDRGEFFAREKP